MDVLDLLNKIVDTFVQKPLEKKENSKVGDLLKSLGIDDKSSKSVRTLLEGMDMTGEKMKNLSKVIDDLDKEYNDIKSELKTLTDPNEIKEKKNRQREIKKEKNEIKSSYDALGGSLKRQQVDYAAMTGRNSVMAAMDVLKYQCITNAFTGSKLGGMVMGVKSFMGGPWGLAIQLLESAVAFGINRVTDYLKLNYDNILRQLNASTTVTVNTMKANMASWQDAVNGAYESQLLHISSQEAMMEAQNATALANMKMEHMWTNWIPIWGQINQYQEAVLEKENQLSLQ